jgi:hypothetical protein
MNDRELTQIVQNHTGRPWFNGKAYVDYHGIDVGQAHIERIAELEAALDGLLEIEDPAWNPVAFSNARKALKDKP